MRTRTPSRLAAVMAVVMLAACGDSGTGPDGGTKPPPPPPVEVLTVKVTAPSTVTQSYEVYPMASVAIEVKAVSTTNSPVTLACTVDGKAEDSCTSATLSVGSHIIVVSGHSVAGGVSKDSAVVTVLPAKISGRVVVPTATGEYVPQGSYLLVGTPGAEDSVKIANDGTFSLSTRYAAAPRACVVVREDISMGRLVGCVSSSHFGALNLIGAPRSFTIPSGDFAGQKVSIDMVKVTNPSPPPSAISFYMKYSRLNVTSYTPGSWKLYPVCAAIMHSQSNDTISPAESISVFGILDQIEKRYGMDLFKPCSENEVKANKGFRIVLQVGETRELYGVYEGNFDDFVDGVITLDNHAAFADTFLVEHVVGHAFFGLGHTCEWDSIMQSSCPRYIPSGIYAEDIAYSLLMIRTRELERKYDTRFSFPFSINGARAEQGMSILDLVPVDSRGSPIP